MAAALFSASALAAPASPTFPASGENNGASAFAQPTSTIARAQVAAEAAGAIREGHIAFGDQPLVPRDTAAGQAKTRAQVIAEMKSQSPAERKALRNLYRK